MAFSFSRPIRIVVNALIQALNRLDKSLSPADVFSKIRQHKFTVLECIVYLLQILLASYWIYVMQFPPFPWKIFIPILYGVAALIPITSQFIWNATPVLLWVLTFYSSKFIPAAQRPPISVSVLPTLESVLYGGNISDILTRFTHPLLDIIAWLPYGVFHFILPFVVAIFLWIFRPNPYQPGPHEILRFWSKAFGYMNLMGVLFAIIFPCAAPWYELIYGLTPASYSVRGSAGGLARIDTLTHSHFYTNTFATSPLVFGAFPSLHAACATIEALFWVHFFPYTSVKWIVGIYTATLFWATMYLSHHYLIDVVGGACLAVGFFYAFLPEELKKLEVSAWNNMSPGKIGKGRSKRDLYAVDIDLENAFTRSRSPHSPSSEGSSSSMLDHLSHDRERDSTQMFRYPSPPRLSDEEEDIALYRSPHPSSNNTNGHAIINGFSGKQINGKERDRQSRIQHQHTRTASIASLVRAEDRMEDGWSPIGINGVNGNSVQNHGNGQDWNHSNGQGQGKSSGTSSPRP